MGIFHPHVLIKKFPYIKKCSHYCTQNFVQFSYNKTKGRPIWFFGGVGGREVGTMISVQMFLRVQSSIFVFVFAWFTCAIFYTSRKKVHLRFQFPLTDGTFPDF